MAMTKKPKTKKDAPKETPLGKFGREVKDLAKMPPKKRGPRNG